MQWHNTVFSRSGPLSVHKLFTSCIRWCRVWRHSRSCDWVMSALSPALLIFSFHSSLLFFYFLLANVHSRSRSLYAIARPSVVCLSVTLVHPTQPVEILGNFSSPFGTLAIHWHPRKILRRSSQGNPSVGGLNARGWPNIAIFSGRELAFTFAICHRRSVCRLSVTLVRPTQPVEIFGNFSSPYDSPGSLVFWCQNLLEGTSLSP